MDRTAITELIYSSCLLLDDKNFKGYLDLCAEAFRYSITTFSPEIRRDMTWLDHDREGMNTLFTQLPRHNSDHSPLTRHATVYTISPGAAPNEAQVVSALQVFKTDLDGGASQLYAVGRYLDTVSLAGGAAKLARRQVRLDTRMLGIGYHIPF
jgi:methanesulfonate monooxygenase subunit beta